MSCDCAVGDPSGFLAVDDVGISIRAGNYITGDLRVVVFGRANGNVVGAMVRLRYCPASDERALAVLRVGLDEGLVEFRISRARGGEGGKPGAANAQREVDRSP